MSDPTAQAKQSADDVVAFWLAAGPDRWFEEDAAFDAAIRERFAATYDDAAAGRLGAWETSADGALALVIVLDQFPRNMFRGSARSYAADPLARAATRRAMASGFDRQVAMPLRQFFYLPYSAPSSASSEAASTS